MNIISKPVGELTPYEKNTKKHDRVQVSNVAESIRQYGFVQPLVIDKDGVIVIGHCRYMAAKKLGMKTVPCVCVEDLTPEQVKGLRIADNKLNESDWDMDFLADELPEVDFSMFDFDFGIEDDFFTKNEKEDDEKEHKSLVERFGVPPFSVLDTRQGYWQDRKRNWKNLGILSEKGREDCLLSYGLKGLADKYFNGSEALQGTSIFDPVLCEIMYKWFCTDKGKIYDCFAGGSVRGVVAEKLGYKYFGIDLRGEQIEENKLQAKKIGVNPTWYCDDSLNADKYIEDNSCDMIFSCPPYADLEVYSDDPRDISNMEYDDFCKAYSEIIKIACRKLKKDRFAVFVVGEIRDKKGFYRNFVDFTKQCFKECGFLEYNEFILVEMIGTGALRANSVFGSMRKAVKTHQNVLVFYNGNPKEIKKNYPKVNFYDTAVVESEEENIIYAIMLFLFQQNRNEV